MSSLTAENPLNRTQKFTRVLTPEQEAFRDEIADWLSEYPWQKVWTVTFDRMEEYYEQHDSKNSEFEIFVYNSFQLADLSKTSLNIGLLEVNNDLPP